MLVMHRLLSPLPLKETPERPGGFFKEKGDVFVMRWRNAT